MRSLARLAPRSTLTRVFESDRENAEGKRLVHLALRFRSRGFADSISLASS